MECQKRGFTEHAPKPRSKEGRKEKDQKGASNSPSQRTCRTPVDLQIRVEAHAKEEEKGVREGYQKKEHLEHGDLPRSVDAGMHSGRKRQRRREEDVQNMREGLEGAPSLMNVEANAARQAKRRGEKHTTQEPKGGDTRSHLYPRVMAITWSDKRRLKKRADPWKDVV